MPSCESATARRLTRCSAETSDQLVLGYRALDGLGLMVDPRNKRLIDAGPSWRWRRSRELDVVRLGKPQPCREPRELTIRPRPPIGEELLVEPCLGIERHVQPLDLEQVEHGVQSR